MNSGRGSLGLRYLQQTKEWMTEWLADHNRGLSSNSWEDEGHPTSLRWDDIWLECHQELATLQGKVDRDEALVSVKTALHAVEQRFKAVEPFNRNLTIGNLERAIAKLMLRPDPRRPNGKGWRDDSIMEHLNRGLEYLSKTHDVGMQAATHMHWAELYSRMAREARDFSATEWRYDLDCMNESVYRALVWC